MLVVLGDLESLSPAIVWLVVSWVVVEDDDEMGGRSAVKASAVRVCSGASVQWADREKSKRAS